MAQQQQHKNDSHNKLVEEEEWKAEFTPMEQALERFRQGTFLVVMDDEDRENEGDLILPARFATPEQVAFALRYTSGILCAPLTPDLAEKLELHPMTHQSTDPHGTAFTVTIDHIDSTTGVSGVDRSRSFQTLTNPAVKASDYRRPGHIFPLVARAGGVLERRGHTEAAVDLCRLAGLEPVGFLAELMNEDGTMKRLKECSAFAREHSLPLITVEQLVRYREEKEGRKVVASSQPSLKREIGLKLEATCTLPIQRKDRFLGQWELRTYSSAGGHQHAVLIKNPSETLKGSSVTVRVHSECFTGNTLGSLRCDCDDQLDSALYKINEQGRGLAIYLGGHEGRGIGLANKIRAYALQDEAKLDTFAANESLGLPRDGRSYEVACAILEDLEVTKVDLLTNNRFKVQYLQSHGFQVDVTPLPGKQNAFNSKYLEVKKIVQEHAHHGHAHAQPAPAPAEESPQEPEQQPGHIKSVPIALPVPSNLHKMRIGIIKTAWNSSLVDLLVNQTKDQLLRAGMLKSNVFEMIVPGSYEVPWAAQQMIQTFRSSGLELDAVMCFGVLIKGETMHFEYISSSVSQALMNLQMSTGIPVLYGILNCLTVEQAEARCGTESQLPLSLSSTAIHMAAIRRGFLPMATSMDSETTVTVQEEKLPLASPFTLLEKRSPLSVFPSIMTPQPCDFN